MRKGLQPEFELIKGALYHSCPCCAEHWVPKEPTELMAQEGAKELPIEGPVLWQHLLNVYRTMVETGIIEAKAHAEQQEDD